MFCFNSVKGIIFDLDDTLVRTSLNFRALKQKIGCPNNEDILSFIEQIHDISEKEAAKQTVLQHELKDAMTSVWIDGAEAFVEQAKDKGLPLAIVTRNCRQATQLKLQKNRIDIDLVLTREDAAPKPNPQALNSIAKTWHLPKSSIAYIGDYIYDIQAAHNANMQAWLYKDAGLDKRASYAQRLHLILP